MPTSPLPRRHRVVIAGGGVAGLEAMMTLRDLAADLVDVTLVAPDDSFAIRALSVREPFASPGSAHWPLGAICREHGAAYLKAAMTRVDPAGRLIELADGTTEPYDSLLVAVGARAEPAWPGVPVFRGAQDAELVHGLVQDVEGGYTKHVAFVVPPGTTWPLPHYELALMLAQCASDSGHDDVAITFATSEVEPLAVVGKAAARALREALAAAGIDLHTSCNVLSVQAGRIVAAPDLLLAVAERVVTSPVLHGPAIDGLPCDPNGFVRVDGFGRVPGCDGVFAAGDGSSVPVKLGGLAAAEGAAAATSIAAAAGAHVEPAAYDPVLEAQLLTGRGTVRLRGTLPWLTTADDSSAEAHAVLWPPSKVAAPRLNAWLEAQSSVMAAG